MSDKTLLSFVELILGVVILVFNRWLVDANVRIYRKRAVRGSLPTKELRLMWLIVGAIVLLLGFGDLMASLQ